MINHHPTQNLTELSPHAARIMPCHQTVTQCCRHTQTEQETDRQTERKRAGQQLLLLHRTTCMQLQKPALPRDTLNWAAHPSSCRVHKTTKGLLPAGQHVQDTAYSMMAQDTSTRQNNPEDTTSPAPTHNQSSHNNWQQLLINSCLQIQHDKTDRRRISLLCVNIPDPAPRNTLQQNLHPTSA